MRGIQLHPTLGVNPKLCVCFYCGKETGEIALLGRYNPKEVQDTWFIVTNKHPCAWCKDNMVKGIVCIEANETLTGPQPTGAYAVLKVEAVERMPLDPAMKNKLLHKRLGYFEPKVWTMLGLREAVL